MSSLLPIASRIEAAVASYVSVQNGTDKAEWKRRFDIEKGDMIREFRHVTDKAGGVPPPLHPTLAALSIVLDRGADFSEIGRNHPLLPHHKYYKPEAKFPSDISRLLPPSEGRWWEHLASQSHPEGGLPAPPTASQSPPEGGLPAPPAASQSPPEGELPVPPASKKRVWLKLSKEPPVKFVKPAEVDMEEDESGEDESEEVDELEEDELPKPSKSTRSRRPSLKAAEAAAHSRKRKGSSLSAPTAPKRRAGRSQQQPKSMEGLAQEALPPVGEEFSFQCERCAKAGAACEVDPTGPCARCRSKKQGCSLMPQNDKTGRSDRHNLTPAAMLEFRINSLRGKARKQQARKQKKLEASGSGASPSTMLNALTLGSESSRPHSATASHSPISATASQLAYPSPANEAHSPVASQPAATAADLPVPAPAADPPVPAPAADPPVPAPAADPTTTTTPPILIQHIVPAERRFAPFVAVPMRSSASSSSQPVSRADLLERAHRRDLETSNNLSRVIMSLEEWGRNIDEWRLQAEELKRQVDARLQGGGL